MEMQSMVGGCLKAMRLISIYNDWTAFSSHMKVHSSVFITSAHAPEEGQLSWPSSGACAEKGRTQSAKTLEEGWLNWLKHRATNMCYYLLFSIYLFMEIELWTFMWLLKAVWLLYKEKVFCECKFTNTLLLIFIVDIREEIPWNLFSLKWS